MVSVSGMFGNDHTYFAGSPVVIDIEGLEWSKNGQEVTSPFTVVRVEVIYNGNVVGNFKVDTGGQTSISFDISSALRAIWADYDFSAEIPAANLSDKQIFSRTYRDYSLVVYTEYIDSQDGQFTSPNSGEFTGGKCGIGWLTEWERYDIGNKENADMSYWQHRNKRNGDASTKPTSSPERVGKDSITSWVDVGNNGTKSVFYPSSRGNGVSDNAANDYTDHAPLVLRDNIAYIDFLFVNRRGAVETCSGQPLEQMDIEVETHSYARIERPAFKPTRTLMSISKGGRRSWLMSSGLQTREWAEWWTMEFLQAKRWWMLYEGKYVPVIVEPAKKSVTIYDRSKQEMSHVDFTVTLAVEG